MKLSEIKNFDDWLSGQGSRSTGQAYTPEEQKFLDRLDKPNTDAGVKALLDLRKAYIAKGIPEKDWANHAHDELDKMGGQDPNLSDDMHWHALYNFASNL